MLRAKFPGTPVCVAAESIGSGPAAMLSAADQPPDKLVFIVPFDDLKSVGKINAVIVPMSVLLAGSWNNVRMRCMYHGPMDVFGAERGHRSSTCDHAQALAAPAAGEVSPYRRRPQ